MPGSAANADEIVDKTFDWHPLDSGSPNLLWFFWRWLGRLHHRRVGGGFSRGRLLHEPIKQLAATLGGSAIVPVRAGRKGFGAPVAARARRSR